MKKMLILFVLLSINTLMFGQENSIENNSSLNIMYSLIGGFVGGFLGVIGTILSSYFGPKKLEEWRTKQLEIKHNSPRKELLLEMLNDNRFPNGRRLSTLSRVTGTNYEDCRNLLIELDARGITLKDDFDNEIEGWVLIKNRPLNEE